MRRPVNSTSSRPISRIRAWVWLPLACVLGAASMAWGGEIQLGVESQYIYNSNLYSSSTNEEDANSFQLGPIVNITDDEGRFLYDIDYTGGYQLYVDENSANAWESRLRGRFDYAISPRTTIRLNERFRDISNLRFSREDIQDGDTALDPNRDQYYRNDLELELLHDLTRSLEVRVSAAHHWIDFDENIDRNDSHSFEVGSELRYRIAAAHRIGIQASYVDQDFDEALSRLGSRGQYVSGALNWIWDISRTVQFRASGGPAWIRSDEDSRATVSQNRFVSGKVNNDDFRADFDSCSTGGATPQFLASQCDFNTPGAPPIPGGAGPEQTFILDDRGRVKSDTSVTFFGGASLVADIEDWTLRAIYSRTQSTSAGDALASSLDRVELEIEYHPARYRWSPFVAGSWDRRETLTNATDIDFEVIENPVDGSAQRDVAFTDVDDNDVSRQNFTAIVGVRGELSRQLDSTFEFRYRRFQNEDDNTSRPDVDIFFAVMTVRYNLDPFRF